MVDFPDVFRKCSSIYFDTVHPVHTVFIHGLLDVPDRSVPFVDVVLDNAT